MADGKIVIEIQNNVKVQSSSTVSPRENLNNSTGSPDSTTQGDTSPTPTPSKKGKFDTLLKTTFIASNVQKIANATGLDGARQLSSAIGTAVKYGGVVKDLTDGNPISLVSTAVELAAKAIEKWCNEQRQKATEQNSIDISRINAGLMDLSNVKISTNTWGRMLYEEK